MFSLVLIGALLASSAVGQAPPDAEAHQRQLELLTLDIKAANAFALELTETVMVMDVTLKAPQWADPRMAQTAQAMAVAVFDEAGFPRLLTGGLVASEAASVSIRLRSGKRLVSRKLRVLGDGALGEVLLPSASWLRLTAISIDPRETLAAQTPAFSVQTTVGFAPILARGSIVEAAEPPLSHLVLTDIAIPHGAALVSANKELLAINYRFVPDSDRRCIAVPAETVRAWLRPEGPPTDRGPSADPEAR